jgi:hypothetical protein
MLAACWLIRANSINENSKFLACQPLTPSIGLIPQESSAERSRHAISWGLYARKIDFPGHLSWVSGNLILSLDNPPRGCGTFTSRARYSLARVASLGMGKSFTKHTQQHVGASFAQAHL